MFDNLIHVMLPQGLQYMITEWKKQLSSR